MNHLKTVGIGTGIHYPIPLHLQKAYASLNYRAEEFPVSVRAAREIASLPMFPQLKVDQQIIVSEEILAFTSRTSHKYVEGVETMLVPAQQTA